MHPTSPKISVVISSYNFRTYIGECIESVLAQTLQPWEIIISDDCSTDDSWAIIREYTERYPNLIKAIRHESNIGPASNADFGKQQATGDLILWMDGDDRLPPRLLERQWQALQSCPEANVAYSNGYLINEAGKRVGIFYNGRGTPPPSGDIFIQLFSKNLFPGTQRTFRNHLLYRSVLQEIGYTDHNLESLWDWDQKIRLTARYKFVYTGETLIEYRMHPGGFSRSNPSMHDRAFIAVYEKNLPLLKNRNPLDVARVKCRIESLIAMRGLRLPSEKKNNRYSPRNAYKRNRLLLDNLSDKDRFGLERELRDSYLLLPLLAMKDEFNQKNLLESFRFLLEFLRYFPKNFVPRRILEIMLPSRVFLQLRLLYRSIRGGTLAQFDPLQ